jgi:hypothetical protein
VRRTTQRLLAARQAVGRMKIKISLALPKQGILGGQKGTKVISVSRVEVDFK